MFQSSINKQFLFTWLNSQGGKMKRIIMHSDWLPERARWGHLARSGFPALVPQAKVLQFSHIMNQLLTKLVHQVGQILASFFIFYYYFFFAFLFPETKLKNAKKELGQGSRHSLRSLFEGGARAHFPISGW